MTVNQKMKIKDIKKEIKIQEKTIRNQYKKTKELKSRIQSQESEIKRLQNEYQGKYILP